MWTDLSQAVELLSEDDSGCETQRDHSGIDQQALLAG